MLYAGMNLPDPADGEYALEACVLMKLVSADGSIKYREWKSPSLHPIEALGMVTTFEDTLREVCLGNARRRPDAA